MRVLSTCVVIAIAACSGEKRPKKQIHEDAARPVDALAVTDDAGRDQLFLSVPTTRAVEDLLQRLSKQPHVAGTPANADVGKEILGTLGRLRWKLGTQQYDVYLPHPKKLAVSIRAPQPIAISVEEPSAAPYGNAPVHQTWNAYAASGKASAPLVDAGYGRPEDLAGVKGKIALVRLGKLYRGVQVANAERAGARAVILFVDPKDEPERPRDSVQRGTVLYYWQRPGDPLTPGEPALPGVARAKPDKLDVLPKIPVVTVSATEAEKLLANLGKIVDVEVEMDSQIRPIRNLLAFLPGKSKEAVILGTHYDAWGPGALDPLSGAATMIEIARGLTALTRAGWQPRRTMILAFWDAEEMGMIGSTEWVEEQMAMLRTSAVAYFNVDTIKAGSLVVAGNPALYAHVRSCASAVTDPTTSKPFAPEFRDLGLGADFSAFHHHAGVPSLQWQTGDGPGKYHVWHSMLDDFEHAKQADPGFTFIPAFAQVMGLCAIRLADAERLPHDYAATAEWIAGALARLEHGGAKLDRAKLDPALAKLRDAAAKAKTAADPKACDAAIVVAERGFLDAKGLAGRPWFKHLASGPDPANGYGALPLPELAAAKDPKALAAATDRLVAAIERVATALAPCGVTP